MSAYLDVIKSLANQFKLATITLKPKNDARHADTLAYLAAAHENNSLM